MKFTLYNNWEEYKKHFITNFTIDDEYVICGFGGGFSILKHLFPNVKIKYILDAKLNISSDEYEIFSYDKISDDLFIKRKFIITPGCEYYAEIKQQITDIGAVSTNIASLNEILYFWGMVYLGGKLFSSACNLILLTSCNLKCHGCSQYVPYIKKSKYYDLKTVKETIDNYFKVFDYVGTLMPVGGETLLYKELGELLCYISEKYSSRYSEIQIFTNGIITPSNELAEIICKTKNLRVIISDYSDVINKNHSAIIDVLEKYQIQYTLNVDFGQSSKNLWFDLGNPSIKSNICDSDTEKKFHKCSLICNNIVSNKLYYCVPACFADIGNIHPEITEHSIDLKQINEINTDEKYDIIGKFLLGFQPNGYLEHCMYCNGYGKEINSNFVRAGEQA